MLGRPVPVPCSCVAILVAALRLACSQCPSSCNCQIADTSVRVLCNSSTSSNITDQLDRLLSGEKMQLTSSLEIDGTSIGRLPSSVCRLNNLLTLNLYNNPNLSRLPDGCFSHLRQLKMFRAPGNGIRELQDGVFDGADSLETISLENNKLERLGDRVFFNNSQMPRLREINLEGNWLPAMDMWPLSRGFGTAQELNVNLRNNHISKFTNNVKYKFECKRPFYITIDLRDNWLHYLSDFQRTIDTNLVVLFICIIRQKDGWPRQPFVDIKLTWMGIHCDCSEFEVLRLAAWAPAQRNLWDVFCWWPPPLAGRQPIRVPLTELTCPAEQQCPKKCSCVNRPANGTLHVYCTASDQSELPTWLPQLPKLYYRYELNFARNPQLLTLRPHQYYNATYGLDVSYCGVSDIEDAAWRQLVKLDWVNLRGNKLQVLSKTVQDVNVSSTVEFDLNSNPWSCTCENVWFKHWLLSIKDRLRTPQDILCSSPARLRSRQILQVDDEDFCFDPVVKMSLIVAASVVGLFILVAVVIVVPYLMRFHLFRIWRFHPFDRDECEGEEVLYDVFLCCSSDDNEPYGRNILDLLEGRGYRVCFHEDDFIPGVRILDNISRAVVSSKRTLCLLTSSFINSQYCMTEFHTALIHGVTTRHRNRVIILTLLDNPQQLLLDDKSPETAALCHHLKHYTYIDWRAEGWQDRLLYALPVKRIEAHQVEEAAPLLNGDF